MSENAKIHTASFVDVACEIACAYVSSNPVRSADLPSLIQSVHAALLGLASGTVQGATEDPVEKPTAAQIRKSVTPNGIMSFLDGKTYKTMKRHLGGHGLDPHSYRARFSLPADYPMVAPNYAAQRSALAKSIGLGRIADRGEDAVPQAEKGTKAA